MRPTTLARIFTAAHLICVTTLAIGLLGFSTMIATNTAPWFSYDFKIAGTTGLEIHNGSACPRDMPVQVCYWSGMAYRREFRIVYHSPEYRHTLLSVAMPHR